jgi:hypothetical protein
MQKTTFQAIIEEFLGPISPEDIVQLLPTGWEYNQSSGNLSISFQPDRIKPWKWYSYPDGIEKRRLGYGATLTEAYQESTVNQ